MLGAFVRENSQIVAIAGTVLLALVLLIAGALVSHLSDRRRQASLRHEPVSDGGHPGDGSDAGPFGAAPSAANAPTAVSSRVRRSGFGFGAVAVAFLLGLVAGGVGIAVSSRSVATAVASLVNLVEPDHSAVNGLGVSGGSALGAPVAVTGAVPEGYPPVAIASSEVRARLAIFTERLKASLPRAAGPELSLTRVDLDGMRLSLGYAVGRVMAEEETVAFDAYILRTVKSLFCGRESREMRFLSENGVVFDMEYTDPDGGAVTRLTVEPGFCT